MIHKKSLFFIVFLFGCAATADNFETDATELTDTDTGPELELTDMGPELELTGTDTDTGTELELAGTDTNTGTELELAGTDTDTGTELELTGTDTDTELVDIDTGPDTVCDQSSGCESYQRCNLESLWVCPLLENSISLERNTYGHHWLLCQDSDGEPFCPTNKFHRPCVEIEGVIGLECQRS